LRGEEAGVTSHFNYEIGTNYSSIFYKANNTLTFLSKLYLKDVKISSIMYFFWQTA
jgi:hypothetical protein